MLVGGMLLVGVPLVGVGVGVGMIVVTLAIGGLTVINKMHGDNTINLEPELTFKVPQGLIIIDIL